MPADVQSLPPRRGEGECFRSTRQLTFSTPAIRPTLLVGDSGVGLFPDGPRLLGALALAISACFLTYREYDYLNNTRQTPKLPDYTIIDMNTPRTSQSPASVAAAGYFGESWQLLADDGKAATKAEGASR